MRYLKQFGLFWLDFVVGDDWRLAVEVVAAIGVVYVLAHHGRNLWWLLPVVLVAALVLSVGTVAWRAGSPEPHDGSAGPSESPEET